MLPPGASQSDVYQAAVKPIVEDVLNGYNGTVMAYGASRRGTEEGSASAAGWHAVRRAHAYPHLTAAAAVVAAAAGQTGSGKTFTLSSIQPDAIGMIPRAAAEIFQRVAADTSNEYTVFMSYIQVRVCMRVSE